MMNRRRLPPPPSWPACERLALAAPASAQTKWNLPTGLSRSTTRTPRTSCSSPRTSRPRTGGKLQITVHADASLFKAPEIKRAVQTGQAQIGEVLHVDPRERGPVFGIDVVPFLATSFSDSKKLWDASKPAVEKKLAAQGLIPLLRGAVAAAGHLRQEGHQHRRRHEGPEVARLQCRHRAHRRARRRAVGHHPGRGTAAGARDRRGQLVHVLGRRPAMTARSGRA